MSILQEDIYKLATWFSPSFPIGGFAYSQGLETAIDYKIVKCAGSLENWIEGSLLSGPIWIDSVLFVQAYHALEKNSNYSLHDVNEYALALQNTKELKNETLILGRAFSQTAGVGWKVKNQDNLPDLPLNPVYPVAASYFVYGADIDVRPSLTFWLHAATLAQISVAQRLGVIGQFAAQKLLAKLQKIIEGTSQAALKETLETVSSSTYMLEICSMNHETQSKRLFQS